MDRWSQWDDRWPLDATESQVLLTGPETSDSRALTVTLQEIVLRRLLQLDRGVQRRLLVFTKPVDLLRSPPAVGPLGEFIPPTMPRSPSPRAVLDMHGRARPIALLGGGSGVAIRRLAREVFTRYRTAGQADVSGQSRSWEGGGYVRSIVLPSLANRGLFVRERTTRWGIFPANRWAITGLGMSTLEKLRGLMMIQRLEFPRLVERDPERAAALVERMGPAFLLADTPAVTLAMLARRLGLPLPDGQSITAASYLGRFGPGPDDDFDAATRAIVANVERARKAAKRSGGE